LRGAPAKNPRDPKKKNHDRDGKGGGDMFENAFRAHPKILRLSGLSVKVQAGARFLSIPIQTV